MPQTTKSKSAAIRELLEERGLDTPTSLIESLVKEQGFEIPRSFGTMVSQIRSKLRQESAKEPGDEKLFEDDPDVLVMGSPDAPPSVGNETLFSVTDLIEAKKFVKEVCGIEKAVVVLEALRKVLG